MNVRRIKTIFSSRNDRCSDTPEPERQVSFCGNRYIDDMNNPHSTPPCRRGLGARIGIFMLCLLGLGTAKPIRVLFLKIRFSGTYSHTSTINGIPYLEEMLKNPAGLRDTLNLTNSVSGTGAPPVIPADGFQVDTIGNGTMATSSSPSVARLFTLLDSIDVLVLPNVIQLADFIVADSVRAKFLRFADTKGIVSLHGSNNNHCSSCTGATWYKYDSLCVALFKDHVTTTAEMLRDTLPFNIQDSGWGLLTGGLLPKYSFYEEFTSYTRNPRTSVSNSGVHILFTLNENTYTPTTVMGDHPYVWYTEAPPGHGGRFFYSGLGHVDTLFSQNYFFRRQFYNAVVWASRYNGSVVSAAPGISGHRTPSFKTVVEGATLRILPFAAGSVTIEIRSLVGKKIAVHRGSGPQAFPLQQGSTYAVNVSGPNGRQSRLVAVP